MESRRTRSCTVRLSGDNGGGGDAAAGGGVLIGVDELPLPLLEEEAAATTCCEDVMVVMQHNSNENLGQNRVQSPEFRSIQKRLKKVRGESKEQKAKTKICRDIKSCRPLL